MLFLQLKGLFNGFYALQKKKGTEGLIEIENPNLAKPRSIKAKDVDVGFWVLLTLCHYLQQFLEEKLAIMWLTQLTMFQEIIPFRLTLHYGIIQLDRPAELSRRER